MRTWASLTQFSAPGYNQPITKSRRCSLCTEIISGSAPAIHLSRSHSWRQRSECPASPLRTQQHEASDDCASVCHSERGGAAPTGPRGSGRPHAIALLMSNKGRTSRDTTSSRDRQFAHERRRTERHDHMEFRQLRERQALRLEQEGRQQVV